MIKNNIVAFVTGTMVPLALLLHILIDRFLVLYNSANIFLFCVASADNIYVDVYIAREQFSRRVTCRLMPKNDIMDKWYAYLYDQEETQTDDVDFLLSIIGQDPQNILEVGCGSGRILVPLAKAGHRATGFDMNDYMLERIPAKAKDMTNINFWCQAYPNTFAGARLAR